MSAPPRPGLDAGVDLIGLAACATDILYRYRVHPTRAFEYVSPTATRVTGYTPNEHYADPDMGIRLVHPGDRALLRAMTQSGVGTRGPVVLRWQHKDGRSIWTEHLTAGVYDEDGTLIAVDGVVREVSDPTRPPGETVHLVGDVRVDLAQHQAYVAGRNVMLTPSEFRILWLLTSRPGEVFSRAALMEELWQSSHVGTGHACEVHVHGLRRKIEATPRTPERVVTVRGRGYRFVPQEVGGLSASAPGMPFPAWPERRAAAAPGRHLSGVPGAGRAHAAPASSAVFMFDASLRFTFAGGAALGLHGWEPEHLIGHRIADALPSAAVAELLPHYRAALDGVSSTFTRRSSDGERIYAVETMPVRNPAGSVTGGVVLARDITRQLDAERALASSEDRYHRAFRDAALGMVEASVTGEVLDVNAAFCTMLGWSPDDLIGKPFAAITHLDDRERDTQAALDMLNHADRPGARDLYRVEKRYLAKEGAAVWAEVAVRLLRDPNGEPERFVAQAIDISTRKRAEEQLRWSETQFRTLARSAPVGISIADADGRVTYVNQRYCELVGLTFTQATGDGWKKAIHPDDLPQILAIRDRALTEAGEFSHEHRLCTPTGEVRWVHSASVPLHGPDGELAGRIGTITDITDRVKAEDRRDRTLSKIARVQEEERATLASDLHDDTIQVMTAALIAIDRAAHASLDKDAQRAVDEARTMLADATERIRRIAFNLRPQLLEAEGLTGAISALTENTAAEAGFQANVTVDAGRYSDPIESLVYSIVRELLTNITHHAHASHVTITLADTNGTIHGTIEDDGVGFDTEAALDRARLTRHIGLDTTIEKLRLAGGELQLDSSPGTGTRVCFTLTTG